MQQSNPEIYPYQTSEIDLRKLARPLKEYRWFIFGFTGIVTLLAIVYVLTLPPSPINYIATSSFISNSENSALSLNKFRLIDEDLGGWGTSEKSERSINEIFFASFLKKLSTKEIQVKVFYGNGYLTDLNPQNEPIDDVKDYVSDFLGSISVEAPVTMQSKDEVTLLEKPYSISMKGSNGEIISSFLEELVVSANRETVNDFINIAKDKIDMRLDEISIERGLLLTKAQQDRLSQIERIKEEDVQKIREINYQIDRARFKAQQDRLNQISILTNSAKLASSLGIIENNFKQISESENNFNFPEWYLYGEKALLERVELLESRTNDDPFIPELVTLNNQLNEIQNNNLLKTLEERQDYDPFNPEIVALNNQLNAIQNNYLLKTLEERQDDSPFIAQINELDVEKIKLESTILESSGINAMKLTQSAIARQIPIKKSRNKQLVIGALFVGIMLSIVLALLMNLFKELDGIN